MGSVYIVVGWRFGTICGGRLRLPQNGTGEQCSPLQGGGFVYSDVGRGDLTPPCKWAVTAKRQGGVKTPPYEQPEDKQL